MKEYTMAIIGMGNRGGIYARESALRKELKITALCDKLEDRHLEAQEVYGVAKDKCFFDENEFFAAGKLADFLVVTTQDKDHYRHAMAGLKLGYDILLEKPISPDVNECIHLAKTAEELGRKVAVCHVLRYTPFYSSIKKVLDTGVLGDIISIDASENVGWAHYSHSYVRGNWRNYLETSPMIMAKCCHDLDLLSWFMGKNFKKVVSLGSKSYYSEKDAPKGAAKHCCDCNIKDCMYNCFDLYNYDRNMILAPYGFVMNDENITKLFSDKDYLYSRCVYHCDNNVVDKQAVMITFEDDTTATLMMHAFGDETHRLIKIYCTKGELVGKFEEHKFGYTVFGEETKYVDVSEEVLKDVSGHMGGDCRLFADVMDFFENDKKGLGLTSISQSIQSHIMADSAENSRLQNGKQVYSKKYFDKDWLDNTEKAVVIDKKGSYNSSSYVFENSEYYNEINKLIEGGAIGRAYVIVQILNKGYDKSVGKDTAYDYDLITALANGNCEKVVSYKYKNEEDKSIQNIIMEFDNQLVAKLTVSEFSSNVSRVTRVYGTKGLIEGSPESGKFTLKRYKINMIPEEILVKNNSEYDILPNNCTVGTDIEKYANVSCDNNGVVVVLK